VLMKINLDGRYSSLKPLVEAPATAFRGAQNNGQGFSKLLSAISPYNTEPSVNTDKSLAFLPSPRGDSVDLRARLSISQPELRAPLSLPAELETPVWGDKNTVQGVVNETPQSVKRPTIVGARRISHSMLDASQPRSSRIETIKPVVHETGQRYGIDPALGMAVISAESDFKADAVSRDGHYSKGLFQLLDSTGQERLQLLGLKQDYNPFDPELNIELGINYLSHLHGIFSSPTPLNNNFTTHQAANSASLEKLAVAAFNAGQGRVASAQARAEQAGLDPAEYDQVEGFLPDITKGYVRKVMAARGTF